MLVKFHVGAILFGYNYTWVRFYVDIILRGCNFKWMQFHVVAMLCIGAILCG